MECWRDDDQAVPSLCAAITKGRSPLRLSCGATTSCHVPSNDPRCEILQQSVCPLSRHNYQAKYSSADRRPTPPLNSSDDCKQLETASGSDALQHLTSGATSINNPRNGEGEKTGKKKPSGRSGTVRSCHVFTLAFIIFCFIHFFLLSFLLSFLCSLNQLPCAVRSFLRFPSML